MKKILIIPSWYPNIENNGLGTFFRDQAELINNEFDIRILIGNKQKSLTRFQKLFSLFKYIFYSKNIAYHFSKYFLEPPFVYGFMYKPTFNKLKQINFEVMLMSYSNYFENNVIKAWKPDLIHAHDTLYGGIIAHSLYKKHKIPFIITEHNHILVDQSSFINEKFVEALKHAKRVLVVSEYQKRILLIRNICKNIDIVGNYINDTLFKISPPKDSNIFDILFIGNYHHLKDYSTLMETIKEFNISIDSRNYCFHIVGELGQKRNEFEKVLQNDDLLNNCKIYDNLSREEVLNLLNNCNVLISTSIGETFGVAMCEALMCGKPVVSTNNGGFDEMYKENINGIKCPIGDSKALSKALNKIANKEIIFDPIQIRKSVVDKYGKNAFSSKISDIYNHIPN